jgi:phenylpropionate dioxygenase-like ring-hydroxylating dioxygenase large terminal subunit
MYINFWYPIGLSEQVTGEKPFKTQVFGLPFVAFRDAAGAAHVLSDTCAHRGGSLSAGLVKDGCVVCPYHGWAYGGDGKCATLPSLGRDNKPPARAKVDAYPVQEKYGLVFAFLGDLPEADRPPIYEIEEWGTPGWKNQTYVLEVNAYYERSVENGLDPIHNEFVHPMQGAPFLTPERQREPLPIEDIPWGSKFYMSFGGKVDRNTDLNSMKTGKQVGAAGSWHVGPNQLVTWIQLTEHNAFHQYLFEQPVDDGHTRIYFLNMRNWLMEDKHDERVKEVTMKVVHEDVAILEKLNPVRTPESNSKEMLLPGDGAVLRYRELLKDWERRGWRIDRLALRARQGDAALAIPCPARRESGNWVLDTVPLIPASAARQSATASSLSA